MQSWRLATRRTALRALGAAGICAAFPGAAAAVEAAALQPIDDLRPLAAQVRRTRQPLLLFFSTPGCPYCLEVRRNYLAPRARAGPSAGAIIREIDITSARTLAGLDGRPLSQIELAARFNVRMVPVVLLVDADLGALSEPLIGLDRSGYYEAYLQAAIDAARAKLK